jgi:ubiquinone biosynthesis protein COQ9
MREVSMASKKKAAKKSVGKAAKASSPIDPILAAGLAEAAAVGWRRLTMESVAARAGSGLGVLLLQVPTKTHLALRFLDHVDARTLAPVKAVDPQDSPRDRLFEILMRRFDALNEHRDGARALVSGVARDPMTAAAGLCRLERSFAAMLAAAGISADGLLGCARVQGLKAVAAFALRAWMTDDSADLAKTMAALDRALNQAERLAGLSSFRRKKAESAAA